MTDVRDVNLNRLAVFVAVVEAGSLTAAAERLGIAKTMVSAHMQRLEREIGASLIARTTRQLSVTDAGRAFYDASCRILQITEEALSAVSDEASPVRGTLRVSAPVDYGAQIVAPALVDLRGAYPELDVELICADHYVDLIGEGIDLAVRLGNLPDSNYRTVKLGSYVRWLVASPAFVARHGMPRSLKALASLPHIAMTVLRHASTLELTRELTHDAGRRAAGRVAYDKAVRRVRCVNALSVNTATSARAAVLAGGGFAALTDFSTRADVASGDLVRLLPEWSGVPSNVQAVFPPTSYPSGKVRAVIEALKARIAKSAA
ncbi:LysR family transcriptional regulator [Paraburkholderia susongensis]|uniref:Transcriptional regulator, LysR family n=1 Tax=Paraburkholderia susongensis TaxID=1515439 RepID=A0A1X7L5H4_9BURK|nr:LysR family transcriptional regulator [Paraburkholderia susongensis]SMG49108.1 transcriptional regulator, LysR family [Paraburkholderia susongensis]